MGVRTFIALLATSLAYLAVAAPRPLAADGYYDYFVLGYPKEGADCNVRAKAVADRLAQAAKVTLWQTEVTHQTDTSCDVRVTYRAQAPLPLVSSMRAEIDQYPGTYATLEECVKDLGRQIDYFERATGLPWVVAFCDSQPYFGWDHPVAVHIDALGTPAMKPLRFYDFINRLDAPSEARMMTELVESATKQRLYLSQIVVGEDEAQLPRLVIDYYAAQPIPLRMWSRLEYASQALCEAHLPELRRGLGEGAVNTLAVFCSGDDRGATASVVMLDDGTVDFYQAAPAYRTPEQCEADRDRLVQELRTQNHWDVRGAFCGGAAWLGDFRMQVLHLRRSGDTSAPIQPVSPFPPPLERL